MREEGTTPLINALPSPCSFAYFWAGQGSGAGTPKRYPRSNVPVWPHRSSLPPPSASGQKRSKATHYVLYHQPCPGPRPSQQTIIIHLCHKSSAAQARFVLSMEFNKTLGKGKK